ncbi:hypothetical protein LY76DRAFT_383600 [Colletotrichum caudatum]|nr:hypothetical protein LY76DRAFT_383600 [Colletotrichum caudatum]
MRVTLRHEPLHMVRRRLQRTHHHGQASGRKRRICRLSALYACASSRLGLHLTGCTASSIIQEVKQVSQSARQTKPSGSENSSSFCGMGSAASCGHGEAVMKMSSAKRASLPGRLWSLTSRTERM